MGNPWKITLVDSTTETGDQDFAAVTLPMGWTRARIVLAVTDQDVDELRVWVQETHDDGTNWGDVGRFQTVAGTISGTTHYTLLQLRAGGVEDDRSRRLWEHALAEGETFKVGWPDQLRVSTVQTAGTSTYSVVAYLEFD